MSKNSVKTILITLYLSAVQDPEPLSEKKWRLGALLRPSVLSADSELEMEGARNYTK